MRTLTDYKRIVSYLYRYENGIKKQNVGFAKIEYYHGCCKLFIHMKAFSMQNRTLDVYVLLQRQGEKRRHLLGQMSMRNGIGDFRWGQEEPFSFSDQLLEEFAGLAVDACDQKYYATELHGEPIRLVDWTEESKVICAAQLQQTEEEMQEQEARSNNQQENNSAANEEARTEKEPVPEEIKWEDTESKQEQAEETEEKQLTQETAKTQEKIEEIAYQEPEKEEVETKKQQTEERILPTAARIFARYTRLDPFEDSEIRECVRIEPQDLGAFPMENWILGNNSFLLHGYYNYRHLIFARKKQEDGEDEYIIGVPGVYRNREKFMAHMFGFHSFKSTKKKEQKTGEFGYWYTTVKL